MVILEKSLNFPPDSVIYAFLQILFASSFRWFPKEGVYNPASPITNSIPKYDPKIEEVPHHVLVYYGRLYCSGTIVSSRTVITCAACFYQRGREPTYVKAGIEYYLDPKTQRIRVIEVKVHEFYRRLTPVDNDIALLFLEKHVPLSSTVKKIPLAEPEMSLRLGHALRVSGYGGDNVLPRHKNQLLHTTMLVVENNVCEMAFGKIMSFSTYCGKLYIPENLLSDNGGGATLMDLFVGILVAGGTTNKPNAAIFTNVSYFHRWIVLNTHRFHDMYCNDTIGNDETGSYEDYGINLLKRDFIRTVVKKGKRLNKNY